MPVLAHFPTAVLSTLERFAISVCVSFDEDTASEILNSKGVISIMFAVHLAKC
ncbi:hypothetical protein THZG08_260031 [Vibrio owensii]|uniref:Uncharacterized protein n=1 Tax=Vibrio jasicida TaxID=766224 RepID=A0AAU9QPN0_9VIBR|nr:hypothetical protein THZG08_260031 [Vibrio owensii]CAH1565548.1 hypothetical protein THOA03_270081 [Vibrio owensii]CAH1593333.1 hypothetical protein THF1C08_330004 [Vibrio jasicida]CAH1597662.1 hypothetical protein THF1A12_330004 [Vibrio jasicida]